MNKYEVREFYGEELIDYKKLCTVMFRGKNQFLKDEEEYKKILAEEDKQHGSDYFRLGAFYEGKLYAAITSNDFNTFFDGAPCKVSGIGGVISDYNSPFKGAMKLINSKAFEMMREKGQYISHLYGFEENYYRQYGYDVSCQSETWKIPVEKLSIYKEGIVKYYDGSEKMKNDIKAVYKKFVENVNLMLVKDDEGWDKFFDERQPYVSGVNAYVHYNDEGVADGYMSYFAQDQGDRPQNMVVSTLWYTDLPAIRGILSYFSTQRAYCDYIIVTLPETVDISPIVDSRGGWSKRIVVRTVSNQGTTRVVDVEQILKIAKYKGSGKVCIKVYDDIYAPWNNDCFTVEFGDETKVTRGGTPDIEMKINSFSSAILGRFEVENLRIIPDVNIFNEDELHKVFYKKHLWTEDHF